MGPPCQSKFCEKSKFRECQLLTEEDRREIFERFWTMESWEARRAYITALINKVNIKQKKTEGQSRRASSFSYTLKLQDGSAVQVCKPLFCSTLALSTKTIVLWMEDKKTNDGNNNQEKSVKAPKTGKQAPVSETDMNFLKGWLGSLPMVPSHYCHNIPTYQDKKFLFEGTSIAQLHRDYKKDAEAASVRQLSICKFDEVFKGEGYSIFKPRKDRCDTCISAKQGNSNDPEYQAHVKAKDEAQAEKVKDKTNTKEGHCYPWAEHQGDLSSEVFASLQYQHFDRFLADNPNSKVLIIWSDGCGYQNRCAVVSNAYLNLAMKHNVTVIQKFLVAGHTQMECDSMHSCIQRKIVGDIYTPRDYVVIMQTARIHPFPYRVHQVTHEFFKLSGSYVSSIRPGKKTGDATVHNLRA
ncbi:uncharacterized protein LOC117124927 [Anneissia japonica]|uniref:uncharacterized protein LOC117124927 n=1 Tax=Anneissia japonica TaxID=1529436 RepID=UPI001425B651|nr:uncharacterized protein LOC117124927 [Anneissia japonica]